MVKRGELPEPVSADHLARLKPLKRVGGKMSNEACNDPEKAQYMGKCCAPGGTRMWGQGSADIFIDEDQNGKQYAVFLCGGCKQPLPWQSASTSASSVTLTAEQKAAIEEKRQAALARKRAREEAEVAAPQPQPPPPIRADTDWSENGHVEPCPAHVGRMCQQDYIKY